MIITFIAIVFTAIYCAYLMMCIRSWRGKEALEKGSTDKSLKLSLVVALHNEEKVIEKLLASIGEQRAKIEEVILVCDHCTDDTEDQIRTYVENNCADNIKTIRNTGAAGKKTAQRQGIKVASYEYVAVTDGDCILKAEWSEAIRDVISEKSPDLVIAPVVMKANDRRLSQRLMEMEFLSLQMITAGSAIRNKSTMCNGANLIFKKSVYMSHDQHEQYVSGDDMFLLSEVKRRGGNVVYMKREESIVETTCPQDIYSYYRQRTRWLRKATGYTDRDVKNLSLIVFVGNATWPIALAIAPVIGWWASAICLAMKTVSEYMLIESGKRFWNLNYSILDIVILAIVYPFVLLSITVATLVRSKKKW